MSRGRKAKANNSDLGWQQVFSKNVGKYLQYITIELSEFEFNQEEETGEKLLTAIKAKKAQLIKDKKLKKSAESTSLRKEEIPFKIAGNWVWCKLGEVGICQTGTTPSTSIKEFFGTDIPFIKPADITLTGLMYDNEGLSFLGLEHGVLMSRLRVFSQ